MRSKRNHVVYKIEYEGLYYYGYSSNIDSRIKHHSAKIRSYYNINKFRPTYGSCDKLYSSIAKKIKSKNHDISIFKAPFFIVGEYKNRKDANIVERTLIFLSINDKNCLNTHAIHKDNFKPYNVKSPTIK